MIAFYAPNMLNSFSARPDKQKGAPVVVLATSVTAAARVLAVLADTAMARRHVAALLAVGLEACGKTTRGGSTASQPAAQQPQPRSGAPRRTAARAAGGSAAGRLVASAAAAVRAAAAPAAMTAAAAAAAAAAPAAATAAAASSISAPAAMAAAVAAAAEPALHTEVQQQLLHCGRRLPPPAQRTSCSCRGFRGSRAAPPAEQLGQGLPNVGGTANAALNCRQFSLLAGCCQHWCCRAASAPCQSLHRLPPVRSLAALPPNAAPACHASDCWPQPSQPLRTRPQPTHGSSS